MGARITEIPTPALLIELERLMRNINSAATRASELGVALRPHVKTHKCIEIAALQRRRGARGLTVSTLIEAEVFAEAGFDDLTLAVPLSPDKVPAVIDLARRTTLRVLVDDTATFETLERASDFRCVPVHVWLKVDCGYHRAGVDPDTDTTLELATRISRSDALRFDGLLTHAGHAYATQGEPERRREIAFAERDTMLRLAKKLRDAGVTVPNLSLGSTPTFACIDHLDGIDEVRPGNYVFYDLSQVALGSCELEEIAVSVLATVISHPPGAERAVIDAGALALSKDSGPEGQLSRWGAISADPATTEPDEALALDAISQEHGIVRPTPPRGLDQRLPVGAKLRITPNHSCLTAACFDEVYVVDGLEIVDCWKIHRQR